MTGSLTVVELRTTQYRPVLKGFETLSRRIDNAAKEKATQYRPVLKGFETVN